MQKLKRVFFNLIPILLFSAVLLSCGGGETGKKKPELELKKPTYEDTLNAQKDSLNIHSDYDMKTVDKNHQKEFIQNLAKIEGKYGEQWDFCTCVVKNDSINKAFMKDGISDRAFDALLIRSEFIDNKCQAFMVQSPNQTPEQRMAHEKKVKDCLKQAKNK